MFSSLGNRLSWSQFTERKTFFLYSASSLLLKFTAMFGAIIVLRWISPASMGIWQTLLLFNSYSSIIGLGVVSGLNRELPFFLGKGDHKLAYELAGTAQTYALSTAILGFFAFISAIFVSGVSEVEWIVGLICIGLAWFFNTYKTYLFATFRSNTAFDKLAYQQFVESAVQVISLVLIWQFEYVGMAIRFVLIAAVSTLILHRTRPIRVRPSFRLNKLWMLMQTGLWLYGSTYLYTLGMGFDRVILLRVTDVNTVGLYAPLAAITTVMSTIPITIRMYMNPRILYNLGSDGDATKVWRSSLLTLGASLLLCLPIAVVGWLLIPWGIEMFFPDYQLAIPAARLTLISGLLLAAKSVTVSLNALKAWFHLYLYIGLFVVGKWVAPNYFVSQFDPLVGLAVGNIMATSVMLVAGIAISYHAAIRHTQFKHHFDSQK